VTYPQGDAHGVEVHDARGVVVANYGQVFNYYGQASQPLKSVIRSENFRALVDNRLKTFVGREFVFEEIDRILGGAEGDSGYIVIRGEPGIGRTAIAAALAIRGYVHHFNIAADNIRTAGQFLENVCAQLILKYRLPYDALPQRAEDDSGFLSRLLSEAADAARDHGELPVVIVVDALDEAERDGYRAGVNRLYLPRTLPPGVFMVVTTRDEHDIQLFADKQKDIWIRDDDERNMEDVAQYVRGFVAAHPGDLVPLLAGAGLDVDKFVETITEASQGNFMYLVYILPDVARGRLSLDPSHETAGLPKGLEAYYLQHWGSMKDEALFASRQRPVLCFLAISLAPVTVMRLVEWTHLEPGDVRQVVSSWREFLNCDGATPEHYRLYHRSFAEFLDRQEDLRWYHDKLATAGLDEIPGFHL
jgi:hypothetical protein